MVPGVTIKFQKCGLPHIHLLLFLKQQFQIHDAHNVNSIVSAQIPDPVTQPILYPNAAHWLWCACKLTLRENPEPTLPVLILSPSWLQLCFCHNVRGGVNDSKNINIHALDFLHHKFGRDKEGHWLWWHTPWSLPNLSNPHHCTDPGHAVNHCCMNSGSRWKYELNRGEVSEHGRCVFIFAIRWID